VKHVLVLTHSGDLYVVDRVMAALERRGAHAHRFDTDRFPSEVRLAASFGGKRRTVLRSKDVEIDLSTISSVWARRIWPPRIDERVGPKLREGAARESAAALAGVLDSLHGSAWIDPPERARAADNKLRQLRIAGDVGLEVPPTLVTNDPDEVRAFREANGALVAKMLTPLSVGMEHQAFFVRTSLVRDEDLEHLDALRHAPMVFQALVPKSIELRVACVGRRAFAGAIDASRSERGKGRLAARAAGRGALAAGRGARRRRREGVRADGGARPALRRRRPDPTPGRSARLPRDQSDGRMGDAGEGPRAADLGCVGRGAPFREPERSTGGRMRALIVTKSNDNESVEYVSRALERRGAKPFRLDTDRFPTEVKARIRIEDGRAEAQLESAGDVIDTSEIAGAWHRRLEIGAKIPTTMDKRLRMPSVEESRRVLFGLLASLACPVVDRWRVLRHAEQKQLQLEIARKVGLEIPRTLVTNDPAAAREFWDACRGNVITKMMTGFAVMDEGREKVVFTTPLKEADLGALDQLSLCPMTFQEKLEKALELRVTIVGERVFAASIDSSQMERSKTDWRREGFALISSWKPYALPADVEKGLLALMDTFALNYGAIDVIVTPEGKHVFLEVNPAGEFFWLERESGMPISEAIADVMLGRAKGRTGPAAPPSSPPGSPPRSGP
jgi:glutathione synthase/RimK-type ligase-like ATP-grasp enzyme